MSDATHSSRQASDIVVCAASSASADKFCCNTAVRLISKQPDEKRAHTEQPMTGRVLTATRPHRPHVDLGVDKQFTSSMMLAHDGPPDLLVAIDILAVNRTWTMAEKKTDSDKYR